MATLAAIAEVPNLIKACFVDDVANSAGCYLINFYVNGIKTAIMVDDWFPCSNGKLAFGKSKGEGELWISLLEKAWAKLLGTY
jgi:hypothetical protein